jgi:hypothetical protein
MAWVVIVLIILIVAAATAFAAYGLWGLDLPFPRPRPPLRAGPIIVAADPLSTIAIRLTIEKGFGPAEVELERTVLPDPPTLSLFTLYGIYDDEGLVPDTIYQYRVRFTNPISAWSAPKSARTLVNALHEGELDTVGRGWQGYCLVQRFEAFTLSRSGNFVSITLRAPPSGLSIERIYISRPHPSPGADPYDSVASGGALHDTMTQARLVIPPSSQSQTVTVPAIAFAVDESQPLLIAVEFSAFVNSDVMYKEVPPGKAVGYYKLLGPLQPGEEPEARKTNRDAYLRSPTDTTKGGIYLIEKIEVGDAL